jgi:hypothetical protein
MKTDPVLSSKDLSEINCNKKKIQTQYFSCKKEKEKKE